MHSGKPCDNPICSPGNLSGRFAAGATVSINHPAGPRLANIRGPLAFVIAVIPLGQVRFDVGPVPKPRQLAGSGGTLPWTGQHAGKYDVMERRCKRARLVLAMPGQWDIGTTGVLTGKRPLGFSMPDKVNPEDRAHLRSIAVVYSPWMAARLQLARRDNACCAAVTLAS
jgi:hypothetical protein